MQRWFKSPNSSIDPIVSAVERLARKKIGALIAIERTTQLGGVSETGVRLDAVISTELIETIFWPGSALHDLGVIINQNRVIAAGCQFPLAESGDVDRSLGSRHRAALGMSYETDVVVIVVSEETGTISVAIHGKLQRALTPTILRNILMHELINRYGPDDPEAQRKIITTKEETESKRGHDGTGQAA